MMMLFFLEAVLPKVVDVDIQILIFFTRLQRYLICVDSRIIIFKAVVVYITDTKIENTYSVQDALSETGIPVALPVAQISESGMNAVSNGVTG